MYVCVYIHTRTHTHIVETEKKREKSQIFLPCVNTNSKASRRIYMLDDPLFKILEILDSM